MKGGRCPPVFTWFVANGDLHAKNISIIRWLSPGKLGRYPEVSHLSYSPIYDLVNTRIYFPGERFAIAVNGKNDKLRKKDFSVIAARWGGAKSDVSQLMEDLASSIHKNLDEVLEQSQLPLEQREAYKNAVVANIASSLG
jgi:serine/threonine-protein kinase HipA